MTVQVFLRRWAWAVAVIVALALMITILFGVVWLAMRHPWIGVPIAVLVFAAWFAALDWEDP